MQYAMVVLLIVILEIVAGILGFVYRGAIVSQYKCSYDRARLGFGNNNYDLFTVICLYSGMLSCL